MAKDIEKLTSQINAIKQMEVQVNRDLNEWTRNSSQRKNKLSESNKNIVESEKTLAILNKELVDIQTRAKNSDLSKEQALILKRKQIETQLADLLEREVSLC